MTSIIRLEYSIRYLGRCSTKGASELRLNIINQTLLAATLVVLVADCSRSQPKPEATGGATYVDVHGRDGCAKDCSGENAGYRWAWEHDVTDKTECAGPSGSFRDGCEAYAKDHPENDRSDLPE